MNIKRYLVNVLILCITGLLFTGCGGKDSGDTKKGCRQISQEEEQTVLTQPETPVIMQIEIAGSVIFGDFAENDSAQAFRELLEKEPLILNMKDYSGIEKVGVLEQKLPENEEQITSESGDIVLYEGDRIAICYDSDSCGFTRIGKIDEAITEEELRQILGENDVRVTFSISQKAR